MSTPGHSWLHMISRERSRSVMSAVLSEVTVQWFRKTIKVPVQSAILCCALIKDKRSHETQNHTDRIDFHYHSQWLLLTCTHMSTHKQAYSTMQTHILNGLVWKSQLILVSNSIHSERKAHTYLWLDQQKSVWLQNSSLCSQFYLPFYPRGADDSLIRSRWDSITKEGFTSE